MKRNIERFPEDFCFQITDEEMNSLRFQNGTLKNQNDRGQHAQYLPYAYTEQGVAMLSGLLKNEIAIQVSIKIISLQLKTIYSDSDYLVPFELLKQFCDDINSADIPMKDIGHMRKKSGLEELPKSYRVD